VGIIGGVPNNLPQMHAIAEDMHATDHKLLKAWDFSLNQRYTIEYEILGTSFLVGIHDKVADSSI
jgi:hypothetical protein